MGRGLSPLQRTMLELALRNHDAEGRPFDTDMGADAYYEEVYAAAYGWTPRPVWSYSERAWVPPGPELRRIERRFDPAAGQGRGAVMVAVSRAARRLDQRGLAHAVHGAGGWAGISLTPEGYEVAKQLSVTPPENSPAA
jgi:hypothetical protein